MRWWWAGGIGLGVVACVVFLAVPEGDTSAAPIYLAIEACAVAVLACGVLRQPRELRVAWWGVLGYAVMALAGDVVYDIQVASSGASTSPGWPDLLYFLGYASAFVSIMALLRRAAPGTNVEAGIDAAILTVAAGSLVAALVVQPAVVDANRDLWATFFAVAYPATDLVLLGMLFRLVMSRTRPKLSVMLVAAAYGATFVADLGYAFVDTGGFGGVVPQRLDVLYLVATMTLAAAAWLPDHAWPQRDRERTGLSRRVSLLVACMTVPLVLVYFEFTGHESLARIVAIAMVVVVALILVRFQVTLRTLESQSDALASVASTDPLTGLANRRTLDIALEELEGDRETLTVLMLDIDRFTDYNDEYGHAAGDRALASCSTAWRQVLPPRALFARYGGEEFVIVLPGYDLGGATALGKRIRSVTPRPHTVSIGDAERRPGETGYDVLNRADRALHRAKANGRDRVVSD